MKKANDAKNLTDEYIYKIISLRKINIKMNILQKYPQVIQSYREMQLIKRANNIYVIPKLNLNLNFGGDKKVMKKFTMDALHKKYTKELPNTFLNRRMLHNILPKDNLEDFADIMQIKRSQLFLKREAKVILGNEKICCMCGMPIDKNNRYYRCKICYNKGAAERTRRYRIKKRELNKIKQNEQSTVI